MQDRPVHEGGGLMTWSRFDSEHDSKQYDPKEQQIVAEGISLDAAINMCKQTPFISLFGEAVMEATNPETGKLDEFILDIKVKNIEYTQDNL